MHCAEREKLLALRSPSDNNNVRHFKLLEQWSLARNAEPARPRRPALAHTRQFTAIGMLSVHQFIKDELQG